MNLFRRPCLDAASKSRWLARLRNVRGDLPAAPGEPSPAQRLAFARRALEISLGEVVVPDLSTPLTRLLVKWLFVDLPLPWPSGAARGGGAGVMPALATRPPRSGGLEGLAPDAPARSGGPFDAERERLEAAIERFVAAQAATPGQRVLSPSFGPQTLRAWGRLHGRFLDEHLRRLGA